MSASNLHIGLLLYDLGVGGAERSTLMLASALADVGHRVKFFVYRNRFDLVGELDPRVQLVMAGEGAERPRLEQLAATLGVADHTHMVGLERNASRAFRSVDFFVSCSESEGFCRTDLEALQQGCAVLSTDCPSGPRAVLADGRFGLLCPNSTTGLQAGLVELLERGPVPIDQTALDVHLEQFAPQAIARQWSELFERVLRTCQ